MQRLDCDADAAVDYAFHQASEVLSAGADALHQLDPAQIVERIEGDAADRDGIRSRERVSLRLEIFAGLLAYLMADGPHPWEVLSRAEGFLWAYAPDLARRIGGEKRWVADDVVKEIFRLRSIGGDQRWSVPGRAALFDWNAELSLEEDAQTVRETLRKLAEMLVSQGMTWRIVTATALCLAKAFLPQSLRGMSLEHLAILCGDGGGRATPSARIKRLYNKQVAMAGYSRSFLHFQKTAGTVEKYRSAAAGNKNRTNQKRRR